MIQGITLGVGAVMVYFFERPEFISLFRRELISCDFYKCRVKETSYSYCDDFIESETSSIIDLHIWFECTGLLTNHKGFFEV